METINKKQLKYSKSLRNKAIRVKDNELANVVWDCNHLLYAFYDNDFWSLPNAFFGVRGDIYSDYKPLKNDIKPTEPAPLDQIIDKLTFMGNISMTGENESLYFLEDSFLRIGLDKRFFDFILECYPGAEIRHSGDWLKPVGFFIDGVIVAIQMPVRHKGV